MKARTNNLNPNKDTDKNCSVCRDLLVNMQEFFGMLDAACKFSASDWLTVEDVAEELKVSKSIVYRIIRNGELEAIDIVETNGQIAQKGHYRIKRQSLNQYLEAKKVKAFPDASVHISRPRQFPKVKNHLGL